MKEKACVCGSEHLHLFTYYLLIFMHTQQKRPQGVHIHMSKLHHQPGLKSQALNSLV